LLLLIKKLKMRKNFKFILFIVVGFIFKITIAQPKTIFKDVLLNGRSAKLNLATGEFILVGSDGNDSIVNARKKNNEDFSLNRLNYHTVQPEEDLVAIAEQYGLSSAVLFSKNKLKTTKIRVGQKLRVRNFDEEDLSDPGDIWIVEKGNSLYGISKKSGVSISTIKRLNGLTSNNLSIGQKLYLK